MILPRAQRLAGAASAVLLLFGVASSAEVSRELSKQSKIDWDVDHNQIEVRAPGGSTVRISPSGALNHWPDLSPDGQWIAYSQDDGPRDVGKSWKTPASLWKVKVDGTGQAKLLDVRTSADVKRALSGFSEVCWSRDGRQLYFVADGATSSTSPGQEGTIHRVRPDGTGEKFVTFGEMLSTVHGGRFDGYLITARMTVVSPRAVRDRAVIVRPDGRWEHVIPRTHLVSDGGNIKPLYRWLRSNGAEPTHLGC